MFSSLVLTEHGPLSRATMNNVAIAAVRTASEPTLVIVYRVRDTDLFALIRSEASRQGRSFRQALPRFEQGYRLLFAGSLAGPKV
jgi:hypothetical protein